MKRQWFFAWLPIITLPLGVILLGADGLPRWAFMWLFAFSIYISCKWLTWFTTQTVASIPRQLGYMLLWPGLDAHAFLNTPTQRSSSTIAWLGAFANFIAGIVMITIASQFSFDEYHLVRGWLGMVGIVFLLHFGLFGLLCQFWQSRGVHAKPLMNWPILATSVSEFWGMRWNTAFRDLAHRLLFRPLTASFGPRVALIVGFLFSGIVHDLVISLPAQGGYGGPTLFFLAQAAAILFERSPAGNRFGLGRGLRGWMFTMAVLVAPICLLFHPPFVRNVIIPFLDAIADALA